MVSTLKGRKFHLDYVAHEERETGQSAHDDVISTYAFHRAECQLIIHPDREDPKPAHSKAFYLETDRVFDCHFKTDFLESLFCTNDKELLKRVRDRQEFYDTVLDVLWGKVRSCDAIPIPTLKLFIGRRSRSPSVDVDIDELESRGIVRTVENFAGCAL